MSFPIDVSTRVSPELSAVMEPLVNDPDIEEPITLGFVRQRIAGELVGKLDDSEQLHFDSSHTLVGEIDTLIEQYGEDAPAIDFVIAKASEPLSRVIEALMNDANSPQRPTLAAVQAAITRGVIARLVGEGAIDPDDEPGLLDEIQYMIQHFGPASLAEHFIRYE
jgi:hypothetical protein